MQFVIEMRRDAPCSTYSKMMDGKTETLLFQALRSIEKTKLKLQNRYWTRMAHFHWQQIMLFSWLSLFIMLHKNDLRD